MNKIDWNNIENMRRMGEYENRILALIDEQDELTRSDLQGCVTAIVMQIMHDTVQKTPIFTDDKSKGTLSLITARV